MDKMKRYRERNLQNISQLKDMLQRKAAEREAKEATRRGSDLQVCSVEDDASEDPR